MLRGHSTRGVLGARGGAAVSGGPVLRRWGQVLREGVLRLKVEGMGKWPGARRMLPGRQKAGQRPEVFRGWGVHMTAAEGGGRDRYARSPEGSREGLGALSEKTGFKQEPGHADTRRGQRPAGHRTPVAEAAVWGPVQEQQWRC